MTPNEYLAKVLSAQTLASNSPELKDLQERRTQVEEHLREHFDDSSPTIRYGGDFHIDVVPGRFTDEEEADAFLYISSGEKNRLKTNLDVHVAHVKESGVIDAIRLMKLWKVRNRLSVRNFILELAVIKLLSSKKSATLATQLEHVWTELRDNIDDLAVEDPANPTGNDLSDLLNAAKYELSTAAGSTLDLMASSGWEAVFGSVEQEDRKENIAALRRAAAVATPTRAWCRDA